MSELIYLPYTYLIGWSKLDLWYYGIRHATKDKCIYETGCHPDELWVTYFTSSKYVQQTIDLHGEPDVVQVRKTFPNNKYAAMTWEHKVLRRLKVESNDKWLNKNSNLMYPHILDLPLEQQKERISKIGKSQKVYWSNLSAEGRAERRVIAYNSNNKLTSEQRSDRSARGAQKKRAKTEIIKCPKCGREFPFVSKATATKHHFDNCRVAEKEIIMQTGREIKARIASLEVPHVPNTISTGNPSETKRLLAERPQIELIKKYNKYYRIKLKKGWYVKHTNWLDAAVMIYQSYGEF